MSNNIGSGTALGLVEYLDKIVEKGRATSGAIKPLKTAFVKVMEAVDGKEWQNVAVDSINIDEHIARFAILTSGTYTDSSISVYKSRVNKAVEWYKKFNDQPGWMPLIKPRAPRSDSKKMPADSPISNQSGRHSGASADITEEDTTTQANNTERHEIVFSSGLKALVILPIKRNKGDMLKLEKFVEYLKAISNVEGEESEPQV